MPTFIETSVYATWAHDLYSLWPFATANTVILDKVSFIILLTLTGSITAMGVLWNWGYSTDSKNKHNLEFQEYPRDNICFIENEYYLLPFF